MCHAAGPSRWIQWCLAGLVAVASPGIAGAVCMGPWPPDFGQVLPNCNAGYCYVVTPGSGTPQSLAGAFWSFGTGNPAAGQGDDNGTAPLGSWLHPTAAGSHLYIAGDWQIPGTDGCITGKIAPRKPAEITVALVSDEGGLGEGFFAVASARRVANVYPEYDFSFVNGGGVARDINLVSIPTARLSTARPPSYTLAGLTLSDVLPGIYGDGSLAPEDVVKGYRVYMSAGPVTSQRISSGWTALSGVLPLGQGFTVNQPCPGHYGIYFAYSLVFDGGFETAHVGLPRHVYCLYCDDADGDGFPDRLGNMDCCPIFEECDCNDANPNVHPGALEVCDGLDDNCDGIVDNVALPGSVGSLRFDKQPGTTELDWTALPVAQRYDVVRGDLTALRVFGGSYADATQACVANDLTVNHTGDAPDPGPESGFWYLIRAANCTGVGSYDAPDPRQAAPRDAGIAASGRACP